MKTLYHITTGLFIVIWQTLVFIAALMGLCLCGTLLALAHIGKQQQ